MHMNAAVTESGSDGKMPDCHLLLYLLQVTVVYCLSFGLEFQSCPEIQVQYSNGKDTKILKYFNVIFKNCYAYFVLYRRESQWLNSHVC